MLCLPENDITLITIDVGVGSDMREVPDEDGADLILGAVEVVHTRTRKPLHQLTMKHFGPLSRLQRRMTANSNSRSEC